MSAESSRGDLGGSQLKTKGKSEKRGYTWADPIRSRLPQERRGRPVFTSNRDPCELGEDRAVARRTVPTNL